MDLNSSFASRMVREELAEIKRKEKKSAGCASKIHDKGYKDVIFGNRDSACEILLGQTDLWARQMTTVFLQQLSQLSSPDVLRNNAKQNNSTEQLYSPTSCSSTFRLPDQI